MRYHINDDDEVKLCKARKGNCPYRNSQGEEREHYATREEALEAIAKKLGPKYGTVSTHVRKKRRLPKKFIETRAKIKDLLLMTEMKNEDQIKDVSTVQEMVKEWFNGSRKDYVFFRDLTRVDLSDQSRESIKTMIENKISVNVVTEKNINEKPNVRFSNIDLLDDEFDKITLEQIREDRLAPIVF